MIDGTRSTDKAHGKTGHGTAPRAVSVNAENIPAALKDLPQWVVWR